jgi:hypothetical protein
MGAAGPGTGAKSCGIWPVCAHSACRIVHASALFVCTPAGWTGLKMHAKVEMGLTLRQCPAFSTFLQS